MAPPPNSTPYAYLLEQFNLILCCLSVVACRLDHLGCHVARLPLVPAQPHGAEVTPAQLAHDSVAPSKELSNLDRVVATWKSIGQWEVNG